MGIDMGLHMMQVPEEYGGMGLDTTTTAMMIEEGAKVESTYMGMFNVTSMGGKIVMSAGTEEQKQYYAGLLQKGYISAFCLTEPNACLLYTSPAAMVSRHPRNNTIMTSRPKTALSTTTAAMGSRLGIRPGRDSSKIPSSREAA